jgi:hypothetical protein
VEDLRDRQRPVAVERRGEARETGDDVVVMKPELTRPALPVLGDVRGACLDDAEAAARTQLEPVQLVVRERAVGVALLVGHRREPRAVTRMDAVAKDEGLG